MVQTRTDLMTSTIWSQNCLLICKVEELCFVEDQDLSQALGLRIELVQVFWRMMLNGRRC
jgi:hypothetical protein